MLVMHINEVRVLVNAKVSEQGSTVASFRRQKLSGVVGTPSERRSTNITPVLP